jgi:hypothetical protein
MYLLAFLALSFMLQVRKRIKAEKGSSEIYASVGIT